MAEFFHMGGYAAFVWPSFALWALVLAGLAFWSLYDRRRQRREAAALEALLGGRKRARAAGTDA